MPGNETALQILPEVYIFHIDYACTEIILPALGYEGPLAAFNKERAAQPGLLLQKNVAVTTILAIDREREINSRSNDLTYLARLFICGKTISNNLLENHPNKLYVKLGKGIAPACFPEYNEKKPL